MVSTRMTSREFNHDVSAAKRAAGAGPVVITDRGTPSHVLLTYGAYQQLVGGTTNLVDALRMDEGDEIDFDPGRAPLTPRPVDL